MSTLVFRRGSKQEDCKVLFINETTREVKIIKAKSTEGQIHYEDKAWLVQTDPLFYDKQALYLVGDKHIPTFEIEFKPESDEEISETSEEDQISLRPDSLSPTALRTAVTSSFFRALMSPVHWDRAEWVKAIGVGFTFYMGLKWVLLAVFKVPLP